MAGKLVGIVSLVIGGVILADIVKNASATAQAANNIETPALDALLGSAPA